MLAKHEARSLIGRITKQRGYDTYIKKSELVRNRVQSMLKDYANARVLLYEADEKMQEVDLSCLVDSFPSLAFEYVGNSISAPFPTGAYDLIFVPLYGFTAQGYRLGRGAGWYDKFLVMQPQATVYGVGFEDVCLDFITEPHDVRLDAVITELRLRTF